MPLHRFSRPVLAPLALVAALASGLAANAQSTPPAAPIPAPSASGEPIFPGSLSGERQETGVPSPSPSPSALPSSSPPAPGPTPTSPSHFQLRRPGTEIDGDALTGNAASNVFVFRGNVVLHSDPRIDRSFAAATESDEPLTLTADELDVDRFALTYVAKGHVHFVQGTRSGRADVAMLNEQTHDLDLLGNADVRDGDHRARAAKMHYNDLDRRFHGAGDVRIYEPAPTPAPKPSGTPGPKRRRRLPLLPTS